MRRYRHTPAVLTLPFVFGVGALTWAALFAALAIVAAVILAPAAANLHQARVQRNNLQASLALLNEKISQDRRLLHLVATNPVILQRLADRQLDVVNPTEQVLPLGRIAHPRDVQSLIDETLKPVNPAPVPPVPWYLAAALNPVTRTPLILAAMAGLVFAFLLDVRRVKRPGGETPSAA